MFVTSQVSIGSPILSQFQQLARNIDKYGQIFDRFSCYLHLSSCNFSFSLLLFFEHGVIFQSNEWPAHQKLKRNTMQLPGWMTFLLIKGRPQEFWHYPKYFTSLDDSSVNWIC